MRKKASRPSPRKSTPKPADRATLQITKETIRTLGADELTDIVTGNVITSCPNSRTTLNTKLPPEGS